MTSPLARRTYTQESIESIALEYRSWATWGAEDELGAANYVSAATVQAAARLIRTGTTFSLGLPLDRSGPQNRPDSARVNPQHTMLLLPHDSLPGGGLVRGSDDAVYMPLQAATQWDALCHVFYDGVTYNNRTFDSVTARDGARFNSITNLKERAVGRGVLLDIPRFLGRPWLLPGESIQDADLRACAEHQKVSLGEGDFVLVRTGQLAQVRDTGAWGDYAGGDAPGLGVSAAHFLCSQRIVGVATDTWGLEVRPFECEDVYGPLHVILLVNAGVYIGEMWDMEALAAACANDGVYEFFLVAQPMLVTGAVGSPLNPLAIK